MSRPNLTVWTETLATRVLFEGTRAVGVASLKDGSEQQCGQNGASQTVPKRYEIGDQRRDERES